MSNNTFSLQKLISDLLYVEGGVVLCFCLVKRCLWMIYIISYIYIYIV